jgi:hypothetical protein
MVIGLDISSLRKSRWYEYAIRFAFGGALTVITGVLANRFGPVFGGLFLAFPAIFPASVTLVEKHESEKKLEAGISQTMRARQSAAVDARGAALGSIGLLIFALTLWKCLPMWNSGLALGIALGLWLMASIVVWQLHKRLRHGRRV